MKYNTQGLSLVLVIGMTLIMSLTALYIVEYIIPFSRIVKGIENSSQALYQGISGIEESMYQIYGANPGDSLSSSSFSGVQSYSYTVNNAGNTIPLPGYGSSEKDRDWNKISFVEGGSYLIGKGRVSSIDLDVRVPDFDNNNSPDSISNSGSGHILWQVSSSQGTIVAENLIDVNYGGINMLATNNNHRGYVTGQTSLTRLYNFYQSNCGGSNECVLRLSLVNPLKTSSGELPYLEYKLTFNTLANVPYQESYVEAGGMSYGFQKKIHFSVPQNTTSSAFDFTVLQ